MEISIKNLSKSYGKKAALQDINLDISKGMFGLLGPNGAGKTTLMRILTTLLRKDSGQIMINGIKLEETARIRELIGYLPQEFSMYSNLSVYEAMDYLALLSNIGPVKLRNQLIMELLHKVNLEQNLKTKVKALSGGMKRRLGIAQALLNNPKLLIVDEPTAGLDPEERIRFRNLLRDFSEDRIVILSTHIVEDIEFTCENIGILNQGRLVYKGAVKDLLASSEGAVWTASIDRGQLDEVRSSSTIISSVSEGDKVKLKLLAGEKPMPEAEEARPTLEDAYMHIMKGGVA
ncbi:MAG: transporter ATP-binding protein [Clostridia bacterium]|jgi:ABC-2 type transport system ATP-binding protein|nr:transporter ATP-binding protein [Clostridia bacterium]